MKLLLSVCIYFLTEQIAYAVNGQALLYCDSCKIGGTPKRIEREVKLAFTLNNNNLKIKDIGKLLTQQVNHLLYSTKDKLTVPQLVYKKYYLESNFKDFAFVDYYYDSDRWEVFNNNSAYRLRYRWNSVDSYVRYQLFPFVDFFLPIRCEIQSKVGYQLITQNIIQSYESRFEFRNASDPFNKYLNAPKAPWPFKEYDQYVRSGKYKNYIHTPIYTLIEYLHNNKILLNQLNFKPKFKVITYRYRTHLDIKQPFGIGPNPYQAFILTIDYSIAYSLFSKKHAVFYEIEIEPDRNISTTLDRLINSNKQTPVAITNRFFAHKVKQAFEQDLIQLKDIIKIALNSIGATLMPISYKYKRIVEALQ